MKKNLSYAALAIMALVSCTSNDYVGDQKALENTDLWGFLLFKTLTNYEEI